MSSHACWAIYILAENADNNAKFGQAGACHLVVEAMSKHASSSDVVNNGCWAIQNLAGNADNVRALLDAGAVARITTIANNNSLNEEVRSKAKNVLSARFG